MTEGDENNPNPETPAVGTELSEQVVEQTKKKILFGWATSARHNTRDSRKASLTTPGGAPVSMTSAWPANGQPRNRSQRRRAVDCLP